MSKRDSYGPEKLFDDQRAYNLTLHPVPDGGLILDVGGNIGVTAILLAKVNAGARVVSFEPLPQNRLYLELNLALHGLGGRVEVRPEAVASSRGRARMSYNPEVPAASGLYWAASGVFDRSLEQVFAVERTTIGAVLDGLGASRVDLLKLDCEGCEYEVVPALTGAVLDRIGYAIGDVHLHYAHLFGVETSQALHSALCGRGWGITHLLCSREEREPLLGLLRQARRAP